MTAIRTTAAVFALFTAGIVSTASAQSLPSSKATFAYKPLVALKSCSVGSAGCPTENDWTTILATQIKMASQKDLFFNASLQCGIVTDTTVKSVGGTLDTDESRATIRVRIKLTAPDGTVTIAQPDAGVDANKDPVTGIVFCDRVQQLSAKFAGLNCRADATGLVTCTDPEELQLILKTLNANAFNFLAANRVAGVHKVEVQATTSASGTTPGIDGSLNKTSAFIGAGSVAVESVRMIRGADGTSVVDF